MEPSVKHVLADTPQRHARLGRQGSCANVRCGTGERMQALARCSFVFYPLSMRTTETFEMGNVASSRLGINDLAEVVVQARAQLADQPDAAGVFDRATTAFVRALIGMREGLGHPVGKVPFSALDDKALIAELLIQALDDDPLTPKALRLRLQGQLALRRLLDQHGGALSAAEVGQLLDITADAVRKRVRRGGLLALPRGAHQVFPVFQFDVEAGRVVPGFDALLAVLETDSAPAKLRFFLTPDRDLGTTPIEALRTDEPAVRALLKRKAQQFDQQLAA